jgi:hypothetical protein
LGCALGAGCGAEDSQPEPPIEAAAGAENDNPGGVDSGEAATAAGGSPDVSQGGATSGAVGGDPGWGGDAGAAGSGPDTSSELRLAEGWQPFGDRINSGDADAHQPQLAFDASGNGRAFAVWSAFHAGGEDIHVSRFDGNWSAPRDLTPGSAVGLDPQIAADGHGNAAAIWRQPYSGHFAVYTSRYSASLGAWSEGELLVVPSDFDVHAPAVSADFDGGMVAVWKQDYGQNDEVAGAHVLASVLAVTGDVATWGPPLLLSVGAGAQIGAPRVALNSAGNGFVVWDQDDEGKRLIYAAKYTKGFGFEPAKKLGFSDFPAADPDVTVTAAGNAFAAWREQGADGSWGVWTNSFAAIADNWAPTNLALSEHAVEVGAPRVASNAGGAVAVAWWQDDGDQRNLYARRGELKANGEGRAGAVTLIENDDRGDVQQPSVAVGSSGEALIAWSQYLGVTDHVVLATSSADGWKLGSLQRLPAYQSATPIVRVNPGSNDAMALWQELAGPAPAAKNLLGAAFKAD